MIFVTVGMHEQPFDRLIKYVDNLMLSGGGYYNKTIMQIGASFYEPKHCEYKRWYSYEETESLINKADIVITQGSPGSYMQVLKNGKVPIVVPRHKEYKEHVNNHQVDFCSWVAKTQNSIIYIDKIDELDYAIKNYNEIVKTKRKNIVFNNDVFCDKFENILENLQNE